MAGPLDDLSAAAARVARAGPHHLTEDRASDLLHLAGSAAGGARRDRGARLGTASLAALADRDEIQVELELGAERGLVQRDLGLGLRVRAGSRAPCGERIAAEQRAEQVAEVAEIHELVGVELAAGHAIVAEAVVAAAAVGVGQHLVGLGDLPEALLGVGRLGHVGVQRARQPPEGALDVGIARVALEPRIS